MTPASKKTHLKALHTWLIDQLTSSDDGLYQHRRLQEKLEFRTEAIEELKTLIYRAHEDARECQRRVHGLDNTLDPWGEEPTPGTGYFNIDEYPQRLPIDTLKGYFGEIFAGIIAENYHPHGEYWEVPVFLFRYHDLAFDYLEETRQGLQPSDSLVGRHGDDCLAFQRNEEGRIIRSLACEAKCTLSHQTGMIAEAHVKASSKVLVPTSVRQVIKVMQTYSENNQDAAAWVDALRQLYLVTPGNSDYERCDLVSYVCGLPPVKKTTEIIPVTASHTNYTGGRRLESVEVLLNDVEGLVEQIYGKPNTILPDRSLDLEGCWHSILGHVKPFAVRQFYAQQCWLVDFNNKKSVVGVRSIEHHRQALRHIKNLQKGFINAGLFIPNDQQKNPKIEFRNHFPSRIAVA